MQNRFCMRLFYRHICSSNHATPIYNTSYYPPIHTEQVNPNRNASLQYINSENVITCNFVCEDSQMPQCLGPDTSVLTSKDLCFRLSSTLCTHTCVNPQKVTDFSGKSSRCPGPLTPLSPNKLPQNNQTKPHHFLLVVIMMKNHLTHFQIRLFLTC